MNTIKYKQFGLHFDIYYCRYFHRSILHDNDVIIPNLHVALHNVAYNAIGPQFAVQELEEAEKIAVDINFAVCDNLVNIGCEICHWLL